MNSYYVDIFSYFSLSLWSTQQLILDILRLVFVSTNVYIISIDATGIAQKTG